MTKTTVVFMQVSHKLTAPHNPALEYYKKVYAKCEGYHMPEHFMEVPTWIASISGRLLDQDYDKSLHVVVDVKETVEWAKSLPDGAIILMSVMDVNCTTVHALLQSIPRKFVLGGYVPPVQFEQYHHAVWLSTIYDLHHVFAWVDYSGAPDYGLFDQMASIPRLTLSEGCLYNCAFCTIERVVIERPWVDVEGQLDALRQLKFELVYLDDKTFGQAKNSHWLERISALIKEFNPQFRGFIIQTTVGMLNKYLDLWMYEYDIAYIEVGVEHVDAHYLSKMRKPYGTASLETLCGRIRGFNQQWEGVGGPKVRFIPNIMFALPDADYGSTIKWVKRNQDIITFVNPFILCQYAESKGDMV
ncbi:MAG: radical SAM protein, partial [Zetaproteobacteria bacterium]|nr:radical SAM protein [Zetaproteobacteria bacterium]